MVLVHVTLDARFIIVAKCATITRARARAHSRRSRRVAKTDGSLCALPIVARAGSIFCELTLNAPSQPSVRRLAANTLPASSRFNPSIYSVARCAAVQPCGNWRTARRRRLSPTASDQVRVGRCEPIPLASIPGNEMTCLMDRSVVDPAQHDRQRVNTPRRTHSRAARCHGSLVSKSGATTAVMPTAGWETSPATIWI